MEKVKYNIYPSILDRFQDYLDTAQNFNLYGENMGATFDEYAAQKERELIDAINRVPFSSDAADRGTAFNELVDALIINKNGSICDNENYGGIVEDKKRLCYSWTYNGRAWLFPVTITDEFVTYYHSIGGASSQVYCEGLILTKYGTVKLYGYIDELTPYCVHDIKTTKHYSRGKFLHKWQKYVYPYCLNYQGNTVRNFEYNITDFKETFTEEFIFEPWRDNEILRNFIEHFIEFLECNKKLIQEKKIFNYRY